RRKTIGKAHPRRKLRTRIHESSLSRLKLILGWRVKKLD
ncbi:unnamed protein product, partial [Linum tenue]